MAGRLRVDLSALQANYSLYQNTAPDREVGAVVKADGYGLGAEAVAGALADAGCHRFFVASAQEGLRLRENLAAADIYVLEGALRDTVDVLLDARLVPVLNDRQQLEIWRPLQSAPIAVHVDTGMARLGFAADLDAAMFTGFDVRLLLSHFACADTPSHPLNRAQIERIDGLRRHFPRVETSFGNSAGWLAGAEFQGQVGRPGIGLYGGNPFADRANPLSTVARFEGQVLQVKDIHAGTPVGYGATYTAPADLRIAVVGIGYADGLPRLLSNQGALAWRGRRCPIIGRVSMDLTTVDISGCEPQPQPGDWLECFGDVVTVDEVAAWAQTISYEIFTGVRPRVIRHYHHSDHPG